MSKKGKKRFYKHLRVRARYKNNDKVEYRLGDIELPTVSFSFKKCLLSTPAPTFLILDKMEDSGKPFRIRRYNGGL